MKVTLAGVVRPTASVAVAVMVTLPSGRVKGPARKAPSASTVAGTLSTLTVRRVASVAVPVTKNGSPRRIAPAAGVVMETTGASVSTV